MSIFENKWIEKIIIPLSITIVGGVVILIIQTGYFSHKTSPAQLENTYKEKITNVIDGSYVGYLGKKDFLLTINIVNDSIYGTNTTGNNTRPVTGFIISDKESIEANTPSRNIYVKLLEPGDVSSDGEFKLTFNVQQNVAKTVSGNWHSYDGRLNRNINAERKQH